MEISVMSDKYFKSYLISFSFLLFCIILFSTLLIDTKIDSVNIVKSPYSYSKTIENVKTAISSNNFKVVRQHESANAHTLYFCNFNLAYKVIKKELRAGIMLPCKIKIIKSNSQVYIATVNIESVQKVTGINLGSLCGKTKRTIEQIIAEAVI